MYCPMVSINVQTTGSDIGVSMRYQETCNSYQKSLLMYTLNINKGRKRTKAHF